MTQLFTFTTEKQNRPVLTPLNLTPLDSKNYTENGLNSSI